MAFLFFIALLVISPQEDKGKVDKHEIITALEGIIKELRAAR